MLSGTDIWIRMSRSESRSINWIPGSFSISERGNEWGSGRRARKEWKKGLGEDGEEGEEGVVVVGVLFAAVLVIILGVLVSFDWGGE